MIHGNQRLNSILLKVENEKVTVKTNGLKELQQYLLSPLRDITSDHVALIVYGLVSSLDGELQRGTRSNAKRGTPIALSPALVILFENLVKTICAAIRKIQIPTIRTDSSSRPQLRSSLIRLTSYLSNALLQHQSIRKSSEYSSTYYKCLIPIYTTTIVIQILPGEQIKDALNLFLRSDTSTQSSFDIVERLRAVSKILQHSKLLSSHYDSLHDVFLNISRILNDHSRSSFSRTDVLHSCISCLHSLIFNFPFHAARSLIDHPPLWITIRELRNEWVSLDSGSQRFLIQFYRILISIFKVPTYNGKRRLPPDLINGPFCLIFSGLQRILYPHLQTLLSNEPDEEIRCSDVEHLIPSIFILSTHISSKNQQGRILVAQIIDLLAAVIIESSLSSRNCLTFKSIGGNMQDDIETVLTYLLQSTEKFPLVSLAVASRIFELMNGIVIFNTKKLESLLQCWSIKLRDLLVVQSIRRTSIEQIKTSSALTGALEFNRKKQNRELYWTIMAISMAMKFIYSSTMQVEIQKFDESLNGSSIVYSPRCWMKTKRANVSLLPSTNDALFKLLNSLIELYVVPNFPSVSKLPGPMNHINSTNYEFHTFSLVIDLMFYFPDSTIMNSLECSIPSKLLSISKLTPSYEQFLQNQLSSLVNLLSYSSLMLWTAIISSLPVHCDIHIRLVTLVCKALLSSPIDHWKLDQLKWFMSTVFETQESKKLPSIYLPNLAEFPSLGFELQNAMNSDILSTPWVTTDQIGIKDELQLQYMNQILMAQKPSEVNQFNTSISNLNVPKTLKDLIMEYFWKSIHQLNEMDKHPTILEDWTDFVRALNIAVEWTILVLHMVNDYEIENWNIHNESEPNPLIAIKKLLLKIFDLLKTDELKIHLFNCVVKIIKVLAILRKPKLFPLVHFNQNVQDVATEFFINAAVLSPSFLEPNINVPSSVRSEIPSLPQLRRSLTLEGCITTQIDRKEKRISSGAEMEDDIDRNDLHSKRRKLSDDAMPRTLQHHPTGTLWDFGPNNGNVEIKEIEMDEPVNDDLWNMEEQHDKTQNSPSTRRYKLQQLTQLSHQETQQISTRDSMLSNLSESISQQSSQNNSATTSSSTVSSQIEIDQPTSSPRTKPSLSMVTPSECITSLIYFDIIRMDSSIACTQALVSRSIDNRSPYTTALVILNALKVLKSAIRSDGKNETKTDRILFGVMCQIQASVGQLFREFSNQCEATTFLSLWTIFEQMIESWETCANLLIDAALLTEQIDSVLDALNALGIKNFESMYNDDSNNRRDVTTWITEHARTLKEFGTTKHQLASLRLICHFVKLNSKVKKWISAKKERAIMMEENVSVLTINKDVSLRLESIITSYVACIEFNENINNNHLASILIDQIEFPLLLGSECLDIACQSFDRDNLMENFQHFVFIINHAIRQISQSHQKTNNLDNMQNNDTSIQSINETAPGFWMQDQFALSYESINSNIELAKYWKQPFLPFIVLPAFQCLTVLANSFESYRPHIIREFLSAYALVSKNRSATSPVSELNGDEITATRSVSFFSNFQILKSIIIYFSTAIFKTASIQHSLNNSICSLESIKSIFDRQLAPNSIDRLSGLGDLKFFDLLNLWSESVFAPNYVPIVSHNSPFFCPLSNFWCQHRDLLGCLASITYEGENVLEIVQEIARLDKSSTADAVFAFSLLHGIVVGLSLRPTLTKASNSLHLRSLLNQKRILKHLGENIDQIILCVFRLFLFNLVPSNSLFLEQTLDHVLVTLFHLSPSNDFPDFKIHSTVESILKHTLTSIRLSFIISQAEIFTSSDFAVDKSQHDCFIRWFILRQNDPADLKSTNSELNSHIFQILFHHSVCLIQRRLNESSRLSSLTSLLNAILSSIQKYNPLASQPLCRSIYWSLGEALALLVSKHQNRYSLYPSSDLNRKINQLLCSPSADSAPPIPSNIINTSAIFISIIQELVKRHMQLCKSSESLPSATIISLTSKTLINIFPPIYSLCFDHDSILFLFDHILRCIRNTIYQHFPKFRSLPLISIDEAKLLMRLTFTHRSDRIANAFQSRYGQRLFVFLFCVFFTDAFSAVPNSNDQDFHDVLEFAFSLCGTPDCSSLLSNWVWDKRQINILSHQLCQINIESLTHSIISWRLGNLSPTPFSHVIRRVPSFNILDKSLIILSTESSGEILNVSNSQSDAHPLDRCQCSLMTDTAILLALQLLRINQLDQIKNSDVSIIKSFVFHCSSPTPLFLHLLQLTCPELSFVLTLTNNCKIQQCKHCELFNSCLSQTKSVSQLPSTLTLDQVESRYSELWIEEMNLSSQSLLTSNDYSLNNMNNDSNNNSSIINIVNFMYFFTGAPIDHNDIDLLLKRDPIFSSSMLLPLLIFKALTIKRSDGIKLSDALTRITKSFLRLSVNEQKRNSLGMIGVIVALMGLRQLLYKRRICHPICRGESVQSKNDNSMVTLWKEFWLNIDLIKFAEASYRCGLLTETQLLINMHFQQNESTTRSTFQNSDTANTVTPLENDVPVEMALLVASSFDLSLGLPDAYHGSLSPWVSTDVLLREAKVSNQHWRRLALSNSSLTSSDSNTVLTSLFLSPSESSDTSWRQCVGIPLKSLDSNSNNKMDDDLFEGMWRLGSWDEAEKLYYRKDDFGFHHGVYECCDQLRINSKTEIIKDSSVNGTSGISHINNSRFEYVNDLLEHLHSIQKPSICSNQLEFTHSLIYQLMIDSLKQSIQSFYNNQNLLLIIDRWILQFKHLCTIPTTLELFEPLLALRRTLLTILVSNHSASNSTATHQTSENDSMKTSIKSTVQQFRPEFNNSQIHLTLNASSNLPIAMRVFEMELLDCQAFRIEGFTDAALIRSLAVLRNVQKSFPFSLSSANEHQLLLSAHWQCLKGFWKTGDQKRALLLGKRLASQLRKSTLLMNSSRRLGFLVSEIISTVGLWAFESQSESLDQIETLFLKPASMICTKAASLLNEAHSIEQNLNEQFDSLRIYATILDEVLQVRIEKSFSRDSIEAQGTNVKNIQELNFVEAQLNEIERKRDAQSDKDRQQLQRDQRQLNERISEYEKKGKTDQLQRCDLASKAVQQYCLWILSCRHPEEHITLKAISRVLSLWFEFGSKWISLNQTILESLGSNRHYNLRLLTHLRPFVYQIASRLDSRNKSQSKQPSDTFQDVLRYLLQGLVVAFPFCCIYPLILLKNGDKIPPDHRDIDRYVTHQGRIDGARDVLASCTDPVGFIQFIISSSETVAEFFINLGNLQINKDQTISIFQLFNYSQMVKAAKNLPVITSIPNLQPLDSSHFVCLEKLIKSSKSINSFGDFIRTELNIATVERFIDQIKMTDTGITGPKVVHVWDTKGFEHKFIVKGRDDLRQDAVIEQLFVLLNKVLSSIPMTRDRGLSIRTYQVVPLSPVVGVVQWVTGTTTLNEFVVRKSGRDRKHDYRFQYYPNDISYERAREWMKNARDLSKPQLPGNTTNVLGDRLLHSFREICQQFHPIMGLRFMEVFPSPQSWFAATQRYNRSVSVNSMIGYLMGIGDRHTNNILIDSNSGEFVHIDFGIVFDKGKQLPIPEIIPFRLTREVKAGLGPFEFEGPFRMNCEVTLEVLRSVTPLITSVVEVFVFDPLYIWSLNPRKVVSRQTNSTITTKRKQGTRTSSISDHQQNQPQGNSGNEKAKAVLLQVEKKLLGLASLDDGGSTSLKGEGFPVASLVDRLIRQAVAEERLCMLFYGWSPWV